MERRGQIDAFTSFLKLYLDNKILIDVLYSTYFYFYFGEDE